MSEPFLGEIRMVSFPNPPRGWARCNGQLLPINQYQALFALLGNRYGGNGQTTFALPNLQGRVPVHVGNGVTLGGAGGEEAHTLSVAEMPEHTHHAAGSNSKAITQDPAGKTWGPATANPYAAESDTLMSDEALAPAGGGTGHPNMQPYLTINLIIALEGIFPTRD